MERISSACVHVVSAGFHPSAVVRQVGSVIVLMGKRVKRLSLVLAESSFSKSEFGAEVEPAIVLDF